MVDRLPTDLKALVGSHDLRHNEANRAVNQLADAVEEVQGQVDGAIDGAVRDVAPAIIEELVDATVVRRDDDGKVPDADLPDRLSAGGLTASYARGEADPRSIDAAFGVGTHDNAPAIQALLDTGADVIISALPEDPELDVRIGSTLSLGFAHPGQRLITRNARLMPTFRGDVVFVNGNRQHVDVTIGGGLQPASGDFSEVAGIRVGNVGSPAEWPFLPSIARSRIENFKGNGVIWQNGPHLDLSLVYVADVTHDGIRAGGVGFDANHGLFIGTHVVRAGRWGYDIKRDNTASTPLLDSRFNKFIEAKAFDCGIKNGSHVTTSGGNFRIESNSNFGSIFSELGIVSLTGDSYGNQLELEPFNAMSPRGVGAGQDVYGYEDFGQGNQLSGMSYFEHFETINARFNKIEINARFAGVWERLQTGANAYVDKVRDGGADTYIDYEPEPGRGRYDRFNGYLGLPGDTERVVVADSATGILTVPASTSVAAGATWTSTTVGEPTSQYGNGWASMFAGDPNLMVQVLVGADYTVKLTVWNRSGSAIDISGKQIRWTTLAYAN